MKNKIKNNKGISGLGLTILWAIYLINTPVMQSVLSKLEVVMYHIKRAWKLEEPYTARPELYQRAKERYGVYKMNPMFMYKQEAYKKVWG